MQVQDIYLTKKYSWQQIADKNAGNVTAYKQLTINEANNITALDARLSTKDIMDPEHEVLSERLVNARIRFSRLKAKQSLLDNLELIITSFCTAYNTYQQKLVLNKHTVTTLEEFNSILNQKHKIVDDFLTNYLQCTLIDHTKIIPTWADIPLEIRDELNMHDYQNAAFALNKSATTVSLNMHHHPQTSKQKNKSPFSFLNFHKKEEKLSHSEINERKKPHKDGLQNETVEKTTVTDLSQHTYSI